MSDHFLIPKPGERTPFIPAIPVDRLPHVLAPLAPAERKVMEAIVQNGDLAEQDDGYVLVVPMTPELIDALAEYGAEGEDLEPEEGDDPDEGKEDDRDNDNPADREAMNNNGQPYDDEEDGLDAEPDHDNEPEEGLHPSRVHTVAGMTQRLPE